MNTNTYEKKKNILVTGGRAPVTLHLSRILHETGHDVFIADSNKTHLCKYSNTVKRSFLVPTPKQQTKEYILALKRIITDNQIDLLIPTCEEVFYISKYLDELSLLCDVFCDSFQKLELYHDKFRFIKHLEGYNIKAPKTFIIKSQDELNSLLKTINYDIVIKPVFSRFSSQVIFHKSYDKKAPKINISEDNPWVIQEMIYGKQFCTYTIAQDGIMKAHSTYEAKFTAGKGASVCFQHDNNPQIINWVKNFIEKEKFNGQIAFDFILTDNEIYPLECNPRATSGLHLFEHDSQIEKVFFNDKNKDCIFPKLSTKYMISMAMLLYGFKNINSISKLKSWFSIYKSSKDVLFKISDIKPFLSQFIVLISYYIQSVKLGISIMEISTYDIEWNGEDIQ